MRHNFALFFCLIPLALPLPALAEAATTHERLMTLPPAQQEQVRHLWNQLKCVVCSGQSVAQSQAPLAQDIRLRVLDAVAEGQSPAEIEASLALRYGQDILLSPPEKGSGLLLWLAPILFLLLGLFVLRTTRKRSA